VPILVSLGGNARDIVEAQRCGQYFPPEQPAALAALVEAYADDEAMRNQQSANARRFFESECRADAIYRKYTEFLEEQVAARFAPRVG